MQGVSKPRARNGRNLYGMKLHLGALLFLAACSSNDVTSPDASIDMDGSTSDTSTASDTAVIDTGWDACSGPLSDPVKAMYQALDPAKLTFHLKSMSGVIPVNLGDGGMQTITNRYVPTQK